MDFIRPFVRDDIPQVSDLHRRVFRVEGRHSQQPISARLASEYADYFEAIFFGNPWYREALSSLVAEDGHGRITGFLGVMPRQMLFKGRPIQVAISSQFIVEPDNRSTGVGVKLLKKFLSGPQDLSLTDEANEVSRRLWEGLGGATAQLYSIHWTRPLRPSRYVASLFSSALKESKLISPLIWTANPVCNVVDKIAAWKMPQRFGCAQPAAASEDLTPGKLLQSLSEYSRTRSLWPDYNERSLNWVLETIGRKTQWGELRKLTIINKRGEMIGWYLYHLKPGGTSNLLQVMAKKNSIEEVLDHLFYDAWQQGSLAVAGRLDPQFMHAYAGKRSLFNCGTQWMLIHSRDAELLQSIHSGNALLSKLEGEWCIRFR